MKESPRGRVNTIMSWGTTAYLLALFIGGFTHFFYPVKIAETSDVSFWGLLIVLVSSTLIFWAVSSARKLRQAIDDKVSAETFKTGSYRFSRNPTYLGLTLLLIGFGLLANSLPIIIAAILAIVIVRYTALKEEEQALEDKFGEKYREYQKNVRRWI